MMGGLVGREAELELLDGWVARPGSKLCLLEGEPGIGKTRLLEELAAGALERGGRVLSARASEAELDVPLAVWDAALDRRLRELGDRGIERLGVDGLDALAGLLPALGSKPNTVAAHRVHRALRALLGALAGPRSLLVCLDDVQWADPASIDALVALAHRPADADLVLALAVREGRLAPRLDAAVADGVRDGRALRLRIGPLSQAAAARLVGGDDEIVAAGAGNPFVLEQLARARARVPDATSGEVPVPEAVAAAIHAEVASLPAAARALLAGASVAGDPCDIDLAGATAGLDTETTLDALDDLLAPGLLHPATAPRVFAFRHPLVREAVESGMARGARLAAHARAAEALLARGASAARVAHHVEQAAAPGDQRATLLLLRAADEAEALAPAAAARALRAALRLHAASDAGQLVLERRLADALMAAGEPAEGHAVLVAALRRAPSNAQLALTASIANAESWLGRHDDARRRLQVARASLPQTPSPDRFRIQLALGLNALLTAELSEAADRASDALADARALDDERRVAAAMALRAAALSLDRDEQAQAAAAEAAQAFGALNPAGRATRLLGVWMLALCAIVAGDLGTALARLQESAASAEDTGRAVLHVTLGTERVRVLVELGEIERALADGKLLVDRARRTGAAALLRRALTQTAAARLAAGDIAGAARDADAAAAAGPPWIVGVAPTERVQAQALAAGGHPGRGAALLAPVLGSVVPAERAAVATDLLELLVAAGRLGDAAVLADQGAEDAALRLARGDTAGAAARAHAAASAAAGPLERERWLLLEGQALAAGDNPGAGRELLIGVHARCVALGAERLRSIAARELRRLGHRVQRGRAPEAQTVGSLTARETEIARLVADGLSNREVAEQLVLSVKTVETHIRNVFAKLGVSSRVELAMLMQHAEM